MWKEFFRLNKKKFLLPILVLWASMLIIILLCFFISPQRSQSSLLQNLDMVLIYATTLTAMVIVIALPVGIYKFFIIKKVFNQPNFSSFFEKHEFKTALTNTETKWAFTETVKTGNVNGFQVLAKYAHADPNFIEFQFHVLSEPINRQEYKEIEKLFQHHQANFDMGYIAKKVHKKMPVQEIERALQNFSALLRLQKFIPGKTENTAYNKYSVK